MPCGNFVPVHDRPILLKTKFLLYITSCGLINTYVANDRDVLLSGYRSLLVLECWTVRMKCNPSNFGSYIAICIGQLVLALVA